MTNEKKKTKNEKSFFSYLLHYCRVCHLNTSFEYYKHKKKMDDDAVGALSIAHRLLFKAHPITVQCLSSPIRGVLTQRS